ncbi:hypothetical protein [Flavobacterium facile]|uniref:hypothetical protein n=1 Tax=Flavobacterium facile TaxID=2893174 RepID=UPI002E76EF38|nr:hypothetical protein [Flavobacterium sp. T-12]
MEDIFRTKNEFYVLTFILIITFIFIVLLGRKTFLRLKKLDKNELKKEMDSSLDKSSTAIFIKNILELFS